MLVNKIHVLMNFENVTLMVVTSLNELRMQYTCSFEDTLHN